MVDASSNVIRVVGGLTHDVDLNILADHIEEASKTADGPFFTTSNFNDERQESVLIFTKNQITEEEAKYLHDCWNKDEYGDN